MSVHQYQIKTPNYTFLLKVEDILSPIHKRTFYVGDKDGRCLEASLFMPDTDPAFDPHVCILHEIDALEECAVKDSGEKDASLGLELLYAFIAILRANYPHISQISLRDASYIPCNRRNGDTLDLLTYNIALYGKTWYEMKTGAHLPSPTKQAKYEREVEAYMRLTPIDRPFETLFKYILRYNNYASQKVGASLEMYRDMYNSSSTISGFLVKLKSTVSVGDRCKFFKGWLESWLSEFVRVERDWIIDISEENATLGNVLNVSHKVPLKKSRKTRKQRR